MVTLGSLVDAIFIGSPRRDKAQNPKPNGWNGHGDVGVPIGSQRGHFVGSPRGDRAQDPKPAVPLGSLLGSQRRHFVGSPRRPHTRTHPTLWDRPPCRPLQDPIDGVLYTGSLWDPLPPPHIPPPHIPPPPSQVSLVEANPKRSTERFPISPVFRLRTPSLPMGLWPRFSVSRL